MTYPMNLCLNQLKHIHCILFLNLQNVIREYNIQKIECKKKIYTVDMSSDIWQMYVQTHRNWRRHYVHMG